MNDPFALSSLDVRFGPGSVPEYAGLTFVHGEITMLVGLDDGTVNGKPSVGIFFMLPDGAIAEASTTWGLFNMAHAALKGRFGEPT